jgi:hypothetical protein
MDKQIKGNKVIVVDMSTAKVILAIRNKFKTLYPMFISQIEMKDFKVRTPIYKDLRSQMKRATDLCDLMLGEKGRIATQDEIKEFVEISKSIGNGVDHLTKLTEKNKRLKKLVSQVESQTSMSLDAIKRTTKTFSENIEKKQGREGGLFQGAKDFGYAASGLLEGDTNPGGKMSSVGGALGLALGPFAPIVTYGLTAGYSVLKKHKERQRARQALGGEVALTAKELGISPSILDDFKHSRAFGDPLSSKIGNPLMGNTVENLFQQFGVSQGQERGSGAARSSRASRQGGINIPIAPSAISGSGGGSSEDILAGLNKFYSFGAFKAPYTKKMLELLEKNNTGGIKGIGGLFSGIQSAFTGMLGALRGALPWLAKGAGVAAAGVGGWQAGRWLGENVRWGGEKLDTHVQNFAEKHIFRKVDSDISSGKEQNRLIDRRTQELMAKNPNMTKQEAAKQSSKEMIAEMGPNSVRVHELQRSGLDLDKAIAHAAEESKQGKRLSVAEIDQQIQSLKTQTNNEELTKALKELAEAKKREGAGSSLIGIGSDDKNDPFLDLLNSGNLGEDF